MKPICSMRRSRKNKLTVTMPFIIGKGKMNLQTAQALSKILDPYWVFQQTTINRGTNKLTYHYARRSL